MCTFAQINHKKSTLICKYYKYYIYKIIYIYFINNTIASYQRLVGTKAVPTPRAPLPAHPLLIAASTADSTGDVTS